PADVRGVSGCGRRPFPRWVVVRLIVDVHTPKANVQYTTLDRKPLKSVRNRHQTNTILNTSHEPKSTTVLELKYRSYEMFTIIQEFTEKYRGFRGSLFSIHPLSGCERLQRQGGHKDMCLHSRLYLMIDRPHRQHVLELTKPPFDVAQVLVDRHYLEYAQTQLAGRDQIFTFDPLFAPQACRVLEVPQAPLMDLLGIVAVAMAPLQQPLGRGADLLGLLQLAGRYAQPQFLQRLPRPLHRLHPHGLLVGAALVGIDDDHPHAGDPRGNFLSPGARRIDLLSRSDPHRAIDPLGLINGGQPLIQLFVPPPLQAHQIAVIPRGDRIEII